MPTSKPAYEYAGTIRRVIDGDTVQVSIDCGFSISFTDNVRLFGIDAPEIHSADQTERWWAEKSQEMLTVLLPPNMPVLLRTHKDKEKYGRFLAEIITADNRNASTAMLATGLAVAYNGSAKKPFREAFAHLLQ